MEFQIYLALGAAAGLLSGLFGLGGGVIIVPILIFAFHLQGIDPSIATHLAIGTSLATIVVTSMFSIYTHHSNQAVRWDLAKGISPGIVLGAIAGGLFALSLDGQFLQSLFGAFLIVVALQMLFYTPAIGRRKPLGPLGMGFAGSGIGGASAIFGIGGGSLTTPLLTLYGVPILQAVGTAAACGLPIAVFSTLVYGSRVNPEFQLPDGSLGYIFLPAWLGIVITGAPFARLGALLAHRLNALLLKRSFGVFALLIGLRFLYINLTR
jgi:uncharacterized membrane protein YfcA